MTGSGEKLREAIDSKGISIMKLSEESGVARSTIARMIRTGDGMLYSWQAVAFALGIHVSDLMEG